MHDFLLSFIFSPSGFRNLCLGTSVAVQLLGLELPAQGMQVRSLVGEPRSHMPHRTAKKKEIFVLQVLTCFQSFFSYSPLFSNTLNYVNTFNYFLQVSPGYLSR